MKVKDLINQLSAFDPELLVFSIDSQGGSYRVCQSSVKQNDQKGIEWGSLLEESKDMRYVEIYIDAE